MEDYSHESSNCHEEDGSSNVVVGLESGLVPSDRTFMAICTANTRCGCAIYHDSFVNLVADRQDAGDPYKGLDIIIQKIDPTVVIVSMAQRQLIDYIEKRFQFKLIDIARNHRLVDDVVDPAFTLAVVPNSWFRISHGEQKLIESEWISNKGISDPEQKSLTVFSLVKKSVDVCAIRAISAIDKYLIHEFSFDIGIEGELITTNLESSINRQLRCLQSQVSQASRTTANEVKIPDNLMPILKVNYIDPGPVLSIDKYTFQSLNIFPKHRFFNQKQNPSMDADCAMIPCLYDLLNQCQSIQGKKTLRTIMMWPLQELEELHNRHEVVDYFTRPENKIFRDQLAIQLKNVVPLAKLLAKLNISVGTYKELSILYKSLWAYMAVIDLVRANGCVEVDFLKRITNLDCPGLRRVVDSLVNVIDFDGSKREQRIQISLGVDEDIDQKLEILKNLKHLCDKVAIEETTKYKDVLNKTCHVIYLPRLGFLNSINFTSSSEIADMTSNNAFDIMLTTESSIYFKTKRMEELDIDAGDLSCDLIDLQEKVIIDLQREILEYSEVILRMMEICGELDCLIAFAVISANRGYVRPIFTLSDDEIDIQDGYHPLQAVRQNIVPNKIRFFKEDTQHAARVMVITGPNSCGKTTYMKAASLIIYMAHIGCFVPALYAKMPIIDALLTRIHASNSVSTGLSSFASDLNQVNYAITRATSRSFVAIDEFGKGTQARDGFHLLKGLVVYFANKSQSSPHVMIATHYNQLIDHLHGYHDHILYKTFKITRDLRKETIVYEFKIVDGVSEASLADQVALSAGIPRNIVERAGQIRDYITGGRQIQPRPPSAA